MKTNILSIILILLLPVSLHAIRSGQTLANVEIRDSSDNPTYIPNFGRKVMVLFYADPSNPDIVDPFADFLVDADLPEDQFIAYGIANMKDAALLPNFAIRMVARSKERQYGQPVFTDPDHILKNAWNLGRTEDTVVTIIVDKDRKVLMVHRGAFSSAQMNRALELIKQSLDN